VNQLVNIAPKILPPLLDEVKNPRKAPLPLLPNQFEKIETQIGQAMDCTSPFKENTTT
jgi:hypothetical protein